MAHLKGNNSQTNNKNNVRKTTITKKKKTNSSKNNLKNNKKQKRRNVKKNNTKNRPNRKNNNRPRPKNNAKNRSKKNKNSDFELDKSFKHTLVASAVFLVVWGILYGVAIFWQNNTFAKVSREPLNDTYYQYLTKTKEDKKAEENDKNIKHIAKKILLEQAGLTSNDNVYKKTGIYNKGVFIDKAILDGNGIPINSNFAGDDTGGYDGFVADDNTYKSIRDNQYQEMQEKAKNELSDKDNKKEQVDNIKDEINKARANQGELNNNKNKINNLPNKKISNNVLTN